jgi:hypothetical protein
MSSTEEKVVWVIWMTVPAPETILGVFDNIDEAHKFFEEEANAAADDAVALSSFPMPYRYDAGVSDYQ